MTILEIWNIERIENEIMEYLDNGKKVYIEDGCLNDEIISYSVNEELINREVIFTTSACVFPLNIEFMGCGFFNIDTEDYKGNLFVKVR